MWAFRERRGFVGEVLTAGGRLPRQHLGRPVRDDRRHSVGGLRALALRRVIFGALEKESLKALLDLSGREKLILYPLVILTIFFGVYPAPVFDATAPPWTCSSTTTPPPCRQRKTLRFRCNDQGT